MIIHFRLPVFLRVCARPRATQCTCLKNITQEKLDVQERKRDIKQRNSITTVMSVVLKTSFIRNTDRKFQAKINYLEEFTHFHSIYQE
jgi:hypothetical protein